MIKPKIILLQMLLASGALCHGDTTLVVSIPDQQLSVLENGVSVASYRVSTSRFGLGDSRGSYATPLGEMEIAQKIGAGAPLGAVFKGRHQTGEVLRPNSAGRDPIVTRILWLRGLEARNQHAYDRHRRLPFGLMGAMQIASYHVDMVLWRALRESNPSLQRERLSS